MISIETVFKAFIENWQEVAIGAVIICCASIVLVGLVKNFIAKKVQSKNIRKMIYFILSIVFVFAVSAVYFAIESVPFKYYLWSVAGLVPCVIVVYSLYENTLLRDLINYIGKRFLSTIIPSFVKSLKNGDSKEETKEKLQKEIESVKEETQNAIASEIDKNHKA